MRSFFMWYCLIVCSFVQLLYAQSNPQNLTNIKIGKRPGPIEQSNNYVQVYYENFVNPSDLRRYQVIGYQRLQDFYNYVITNPQHSRVFGSYMIEWLQKISGNVIDSKIANLGIEVAKKIANGSVDARGNILLENGLSYGVTVIQRLVTWLPSNTYIGPIPENRDDDQLHYFDEIAELIVPKSFYKNLIKLHIDIIDFQFNRLNSIDGIMQKLIELPNKVYIAPIPSWIKNNRNIKLNWCGEPTDVALQKESLNRRRRKRESVSTAEEPKFLVTKNFSDMYCLKNKSYEYYGFPGNPIKNTKVFFDDLPVQKAVYGNNTPLVKHNIIPSKNLKRFFYAIGNKPEDSKIFSTYMTRMLLKLLHKKDETNPIVRAKLTLALGISFDVYTGAIFRNDTVLDSLKLLGAWTKKFVFYNFPGNIFISTPEQFDSKTEFNYHQISKLLIQENTFDIYKNLSDDINQYIRKIPRNITNIMESIFKLPHKIYTTVNFEQGSIVIWCNSSEVDNVVSVPIIDNFYSITGLKDRYCLKKIAYKKPTPLPLSIITNTSITQQNSTSTGLTNSTHECYVPISESNYEAIPCPE